MGRQREKKRKGAMRNQVDPIWAVELSRSASRPARRNEGCLGGAYLGPAAVGAAGGSEEVEVEVPVFLVAAAAASLPAVAAAELSVAPAAGAAALVTGRPMRRSRSSAMVSRMPRPFGNDISGFVPFPIMNTLFILACTSHMPN